MENIVAYIVTFSLVFFSYLIVQMFIDKPDMSSYSRLRGKLPGVYKLGFSLLRMFCGTLGPTIRRMTPRKRVNELENQLKMADLHIDVDFVLTAQVIYSVICAVAIFFFVMFTMVDIVDALVGAAIGALVGWMLPSMQLSSFAENRQKSIVKELPFSIDLLASAMRSGLDFTAAVNYIISNARPSSVLAQEFGVMVRDMQLGKTRVEALEDLSARIQSEELTAFTSAVIHGSEIGAPIADTIKIQGEEMRRRRFAKAEEKASQASGKMLLPIALFIMPAFFIMLSVPLYMQFKKSSAM